MMFKFIGFTVLLSMGLMLSEGRWLTTELDPVVALNNYLTIILRPDSSDSSSESDDWEDLDDFDKYTKTLGLITVSEDKPMAKKLRELILELLPSGNLDFCGKKNLETLSAVSEIVFARVENRPADLQLLNMLKDYTDEAWNTCLDSLEEDFEETADELSKKYAGLKLMDGFFSDLGQDRGSNTYDSLTRLFGAIKNTRSTKPRSNDFSGVRGKLDKMVCQGQDPNIVDIPCALKIDELTGEDADLTFDEARDALRTHIIEPCTSFRAIGRVANVLGRVVDLSDAVLKKNSSLVFEDEYETLEWASIKLICEWFSEQDADEIAKRIMPARKWRVPRSGEASQADYMLNSRLVNYGQSWSIPDNIEYIRKMQSDRLESAVDSAGLMNLIQSIAELKLPDESGICSLVNLQNLRTLLDNLVSIDKESFEFPIRRRRLNYVLYIYTRIVQAKCLDEVESEFATTETLKELSQYEILKKLDPVCLINVDKQVTYHLRPLIGALSLPKEVSRSWMFRTPSFEGKLMSALNDTRQALEEETNEIGLVQENGTAASLTDEQTQATEDKTNEVATGQVTSKPKSMTVEEAKAYLNDNFFHKCQSLINNESVQKILFRVNAIGRATRHVKLYIWTPDMKTLQWVPRFLLCKWFHDIGVETFATLLSKKSNEL